MKHLINKKSEVAEKGYDFEMKLGSLFFHQLSQCNF